MSADPVNREQQPSGGADEDPGGHSAAPNHPLSALPRTLRSPGTTPEPASRQPAWLVSPWGFKSHAFFGSVSAGTSEAACTHSAPSPRLIPDDGTAEKCQACLMIVGTMLADQLGERARWA